MKVDPKTGRFELDTNAKPTKTKQNKTIVDEADLETTPSKNKLTAEELDMEMDAVNAHRPGKAIDQEIDGTRYIEEVELENGHKWRKRAEDGG